MANQYEGQSLNHHILSVLVQNRPGVLARVAGLFARRGFNIFSLAEVFGRNAVMRLTDGDGEILRRLPRRY